MKCIAKICDEEEDTTYDAILPQGYRRGLSLCREHRRELNGINP